MDKKITVKNEEIVIDLRKVWAAVLDNILLVTVIAVLCGTVAFLGTFFLIAPKYEATAKFYVNNNAVSLGGASVSISSGDLVTSRNLVDSYIVILNTRETLNDVMDYAGVSRTYEEVTRMLSAEAVDETEIFQVTVTSTDPIEVKKIADAIAYILPYRIDDIIEGTSAKVVEAAVLPTKPASPNYAKSTAVGLVLGLLLTISVIAVREILDISIGCEADIAQIVDLPILAAVPDMNAPGKGSACYGYPDSNDALRQKTFIGEGVSFCAAEAYKLLRTKLRFSFADAGGCRVIGISSAMSGEGKSLTAINLAYALSELGKRVILVDCDMRRPALAEKLNIKKTPGLSGYLSGQSDLTDLTQRCDMGGCGKYFHVIPAGENPPNPIELLSSQRLAEAMQTLRNQYDYVILDFPPVGEVGDALAVARQMDGMLLVVRQNFCNRVALQDAVGQFGFVNMKLLGVVFNGIAEGESLYGRNYYQGYCTKRTNRRA